MRYLPSAAILLTLAALAAGQAASPQDENFDLNISEKRYVEANFSRSTSAAIETDKLRLGAGASVTATSIVMTVRGVTGNVRFRARLDALERLLKTH